MSQSANVSKALKELSTARLRGHRDSNEIVRKGLFVLEQKDGLKRLGDDVWDFLEQLAIAALDIGQLALADDCIQRLEEQFPKSPRVELLQGLRIEAKDLSLALKYYDQLLDADETNAAVWKRVISVLRQQNKIDKCIEELNSFLDTFYSDLEGWLELADLYASLTQYTRSLQALSHALLLAPQNPFHTLHFAETAYTANDIPLAMRYFLRTIELTESEERGVARRAWFGVKLASPSCPSESNTPTMSPSNVSALDVLATERISAAYSSSKSTKGQVPGRDVVLKWLGSS
ncbi:TPR-like protein [Serendipita vermifera]|nr:TPR-like protein [Serendipita vermifera]